MPIWLWIPHDLHATSLGDASNLGGAAYSPKLCYWFDIQWSPCIRFGLALKPGATSFVNINSLEFIIMLLQLATAMEWFAAPRQCSVAPIPVWPGEQLPCAAHLS
jgi:hypothetical protein